MEYEIGKRLDVMDEKLNWIITAMVDNNVKPKEDKKDGNIPEHKEPSK